MMTKREKRASGSTERTEPEPVVNLEPEPVENLKPEPVVNLEPKHGDLESVVSVAGGHSFSHSSAGESLLPSQRASLYEVSDRVYSGSTSNHWQGSNNSLSLAANIPLPPSKTPSIQPPDLPFAFHPPDHATITNVYNPSGFDLISLLVSISLSACSLKVYSIHTSSLRL
jgi:hypothetical protein